MDPSKRGKWPLPIRTLAQTFLRAIVRKGKNQSFSNLNPKERKPFFFLLRKERMETSSKKEVSKESHLMFFFRYKIQHRPPTRREPRILSIVFSIEQVPPGMPTWWTRLFLSLPSSVPGPPGCGGAKRKKRASINIFLFLYGYARFSILLGIWSGDPEIHLHK